MGINRNTASLSKSVSWDGNEVAVVRGLTPSNIADILIQEGESLIDLFNAFEKLDTKGVDMKDNEAVATMIMEKAVPMLATLAKDAPRFLAAIIAVAASSKDDDVAADTDFIAENFSLPLQFECLKEIARMTFVGPDGFRLFLGNVSALASTVAAMTSAPGKTKSQKQIPDD
jgi:hypothetical protein